MRECEGSLCGVKLKPVKRCFCNRIRSIFSASGMILASLDSDLSALDLRSSKDSACASKNSRLKRVVEAADGAFPNVVVKNAISAVSSF